MSRRLLGEAWPFLVGRTRTEDHRIVVIPDFMTDTPLAAALLTRTDGDPSRPEAGQLRDLTVRPGEPVTAIYRVRTAHLEEYGLPGDGLLADEHGRPIVLTEGLVLRKAPGTVRKAGITVADLARAHDLVSPAYRSFWAQESQFCRQPAAPFDLPPRDSEAAPLVLEHDATPLSPARVPGPRAAEHDGTSPDRGSVRRPGRFTRRRRWVPLIALLLVAGAVLAGWLYPRPAPASPVAVTMHELCRALESGHPGTGYELTSSSYQRRTARAGFIRDLLPVSGTALAQCSFTAPARPAGSTVRATMTLVQGELPTTFWFVTLARESASSWRVSAITSVPPS